MKVLIIGYGSIGRRHEKVLSTFKEVSSIDIVSKQNLENKSLFSTLESVENIEDYEYYIISSETSKHYEQLLYLEKKLTNKLIFCEKPLFDKYEKIKITKNTVVLGYVLRFHPLLQEAKIILKNDKIININAKCGSFLPTWRENIDYRNSFSAKKEKGGGVLLDLSHELDYIQWFCGKITEIKSYQLKVSNLEIDSDDLVVAIGKTEYDIIVNFSIDYFSKIPHRILVIDTDKKSLKLDFIENSLLVENKDGVREKKIIDMERNDMFQMMHQSALSNREYICTFKEGKDVMDTISKIQRQNR